MNPAIHASLEISCLCHRLTEGRKLSSGMKAEVREIERRALAALAGRSTEPLSKDDLQAAFDEVLISLRAAGIDYPTRVGWFNQSPAHHEKAAS